MAVFFFEIKSDPNFSAEVPGYSEFARFTYPQCFLTLTSDEAVVWMVGLSIIRVITGGTCSVSNEGLGSGCG